jgi:uncharacterized membrane-anchored protein
MNYSARVLFSILVPIVALGWWNVQIGSVLSQGFQVELQVEGYDPRDLLAGHYIQYRINYGEPLICGPEDYDEKCVCLKPTASIVSAADRVVTCDEAGNAACPVFIRGTCNGTGRFEAGIERFYFSEQYSDKLMTVPPNSRIKVRLSHNGEAVVEDFLADGKPIAVYAAEPTATPQP